MHRMALILWLGFAWHGSATAAPCAGFTDVDDASAFCVNVAWMKNRGITLGCTATLYCPADYVTRLQMAAFMYRLGVQNAFLQGGNAFGATAVLGTTDVQAVEVHAGNARVVRFETSAISPNLIGGHPANSVTAGVRGATIAGGGVVADPDYSFESPNRVTDAYGTIGGGYGNQAGDGTGTVTDRPWATVGGGFLHAASGTASTIGGGYANDATGSRSTVGGGENNTASGQYSTVAGGQRNTASGDYSVALGRRAGALGDGSFAFADSNNFDFDSGTANVFRVRATGGVRFVVEIDGSGGILTSCLLNATTVSWSCSSDRALKQDLVELDGEAVLAKLSAMPVYEWQPKGAGARVKHYGPMAQDFHAAFGLGDDDKLIGMQDADGVALAAIRGLDAKLVRAVDQRDARIATLQREVDRLRAVVDGLAARLEAFPHPSAVRSAGAL